MPKWQSFGVPAAFLLLALLWFGDALLPGRTVIPTGHLAQIEPWKSDGLEPIDPVQQHDLVFQFYPWALYFRESLLAGRFPIWNPYNYLGTPFFANPQAALLFPLTWLHLLFPLTISFTLLLALKLFLAAAGTWFWLRSRGLRPEAAAFGAIAFACSMHTVVALPFPYASVTVLFPWLLLAVQSAVRSGSPRSATALAGVTALVVLAGQPQSALVALAAAGVYLVAMPGLTVRPVLWMRAAAPILAGGLLAAIQWVPAAAYTAESMVPEGPRLIHSGYPYAADSLLLTLIPDFFGSHLAGSYWGFPGYHDLAWYSSVLVVLLAPAALSAAGRRRDLTGPILASGIALLVLLGIPPFEWILDLPGFDLIRRNKLVFLVIFGLAELAAWGLQRLLDTPRGHLRRLWLTAATIVAIAGFGLFWFSEFHTELDPAHQAWWMAGRSALVVAAGVLLCHWRSPRAGWAIVGLLLVDLAPLSWPLNPRGSSGTLYQTPAVLQHLSGTPARIYALDGVFFPNSALVFHLQDARGYDVMTPKRLFRLFQRLDPALGDAWSWLMRFDPDRIGPETRMRRIVGSYAEADPAVQEYLHGESYWSVGVSRILRPELFQRLHVEFVLTTGRPGPVGYELWGEAGQVRIWRRPESRPFRLYRNWIQAGPDESLVRLETADADTAVVEASLPAPDQAAQPGRAQLLEWSSERQRYLVESSAPTVLAVFERWSDGWVARLADGSSLPTFPCDAVFRGVFVPAGRHHVELLYAPPSLRLGLLLTTAGALLLAAWILGIRRGQGGPPGHWSPATPSEAQTGNRGRS